MGEIRAMRPAKLFVAALSVEPGLLEEAESRLRERFGAVDLRSPVFPFRYTDYYAREMGSELWRRFFSFEGSLDPLALVEAKERTNRIEEELRAEGRRRVNLDPGYLNEAKIVLASTKDNAHRVPIGPGIYAEITLLFDGKTERYAPLRWTYPDYASGDYESFFREMRADFRKSMRKS